MNPKPNDSWDGTKDPCTTELGVGWRVPTRAEWDSVLNPALNPQHGTKVLFLQMEMTILIIPPAKCLAKVCFTSGGYPRYQWSTERPK